MNIDEQKFDRVISILYAGAIGGLSTALFGWAGILVAAGIIFASCIISLLLSLN